MSQDLLIEFFSEEIPARMQKGALETFKTLFQENMQNHGLACTDIQTYGTPRRLVLTAQGLPHRQADQREERRGPRIDAPASALEGFATSVGHSLEACEQRQTPKGTFYFAWIETKGQEVAALLPEIIRKIIQDFTWPKSMRWSGGQQTWVRPLTSGVCVLGGKPVSFNLSMGPEDQEDTPKISFGNTSYGHRFLKPDPFMVSDFAQYKQALYDRNVILKAEDRKDLILTQGAERAAEVGCQVRADPGLLEEVAGLVEWPVVHLGKIKPEFMALPPEVLVTSMRVHQRYFVLETSEGKLAPYFLIVANTITRDQGQTVIRGNERVLSARLADAYFFYNLDQKKSLKMQNTKLEQLVFHEKIGTMAQKVARLQQAAWALAPDFGLDPELSAQTAGLLKADLVTEMVGEFPELQGIMGSYYARLEGLSEDTACAIAAHYLPRGPQDSLPSTLLGKFMALLDRLDTLIGFYAVGVRPTGSKDPYALRRTALGILRLLESLDITFSFEDLIDHFETKFSNFDQDYRKDLKAFFQDRLKVYWRDQGLSYDVISAALTTSYKDPIHLLKQRCLALESFLKGEQAAKGSALLATYRRAINILTQEEQKEGCSYTAVVDETLLQDPIEQQLYTLLKQVDVKVAQSLAQQDFKSALQAGLVLKPLLDQYFESVTVNSPSADLRRNRLSTLAVFRALLERIADFSKIEENPS